MKRFLVPSLVASFGAIGSFIAMLRFPAVEGLGTKVRLPVYHGALTWATLIAFGFLLVAAVAHLIHASEKSWKRENALRWMVVALWTVGAVLGLIAAYNTWDFSASQSSIVAIMSADPRLVIQMVITLLGSIVLLLPLVFESTRLRAAADIVFALGSWALLFWAMNAGKALHPDSPVLNSPEVGIKILFFMTVVCHLVMMAGISAMLIQTQRTKGE